MKFGVGLAPLIYPNPAKSVFTAIQEINHPGNRIYNARAGRLCLRWVLYGRTMKVNICYPPIVYIFLKAKTDSKTTQYKIPGII
jgi:hypothetical protein